MVKHQLRSLCLVYHNCDIVHFAHSGRYRERLALVPRSTRRKDCGVFGRVNAFIFDKAEYKRSMSAVVSSSGAGESNWAASVCAWVWLRAV